jgi:hypothetical protein
MGGWWADTDICLLSPLPCDSNKLYIQQPHKDGFSVANALFKAPAASPVLRHCLEQFAKKDPAQIVHGETGPRLFTEAVLACGRRNDVLGHELFFPVPWWDYQRLFVDEGLSLESCYTAHFYNAMINSSSLDKNAIFPANAPFERLKKKYL